ncbi:hypothetical protein PS2_030298 [Malus domestica]|uniref:uncharacterized protein n=1 Tax=Malus domestica TaxID=3750 RepID=UPI000498AA82|nr:uncharacterized protein LOC103434690 [Malus domestica]
MEIPEESMVEEREELMVSPPGGNPFLKKSYFLKPTSQNSSIDELHFKLQALISSLPSRFEPDTWPLKVNFPGWPQLERNSWKTWVHRMAYVHQSTWKKAGIYEAVLNSTYQIRRQKGLVFGFGEKWCSETNTFIFPWGEATITLEDAMVLGGYSVLGDSVFSPLKTTEVREINKKLVEGRKEIYWNNGQVTTQIWQNKFMNSGSEIEHEAFLVFWLCRYVFLNPPYRIHNTVFSIAIHLARGTRIALAPAVLASIYRDLGVLKKAIVESNRLDRSSDAVLDQTLKSPLQLVQVWAWERFSDLRPENPNPLKYGEPRMARWDKVDGLEVGNLRKVLDSAGEDFLWRPYALDVVENWCLPKYYPQEEKWVLVGPDLDDELLSFVRCLSVCELVVFGGTTENYLPHRVSLQFGYDQDLPCSITQFNQDPYRAWKHYIKKIKNVKLYLPSRLSEADVSTRYLKWWKQSVAGPKDACEAAVPQKKRSKRTKSKQWFLLRANYPSVTPGFPPKGATETDDLMDEDEQTILELSKDPVDEDKLTISELLKYSKKDESFGIRQSSESVKLSGQDQKLACPVAEESSVNTMKLGEDIVSTVDNGCASSSTLFEKRLWELNSRCTRLESLVSELEAHSFGCNFWESF